MRMICLILTFLTLPVFAQEKPVTIAVVDSGFTQPIGYPTPNFCKFGHADVTAFFPKTNIIPKDLHGHGTNIVFTIEKQLEGVDRSKYCLVIIKYWNPGTSGWISVRNTVKAFKRAHNMNISIVNYSSVGNSSDLRERLIIKKMLDDKIVVVVAAGNEGAKIVPESEIFNLKPDPKLDPKVEKTTWSYPANYDDRVIAVGNLVGKVRNPSSNYGSRVNFWEIGTDVESGGIKMTGTSQATAVYTGKLIRKMIEVKK